MLYANVVNQQLNEITKAIESGDKKVALDGLAMLELYTQNHGFKEEYITSCIQGVAKRAKISEADATQLLIMNGVQHIGRALALGMDLNYYLYHEEKEALALVVPSISDVKFTREEISELVQSLR